AAGGEPVGSRERLTHQRQSRFGCLWRLRVDDNTRRVVLFAHGALAGFIPMRCLTLAAFAAAAHSPWHHHCVSVCGAPGAPATTCWHAVSRPRRSISYQWTSP